MIRDIGPLLTLESHVWDFEFTNRIFTWLEITISVPFSTLCLPSSDLLIAQVEKKGKGKKEKQDAKAQAKAEAAAEAV